MSPVLLPRLGDAARDRLAVAARLLATFLLGYALTAALSVVTALLLPLEPAQAVEAAGCLSFLAAVAIPCWAFHARSVLRVCLWLGSWTLAAAALAWLLRHGGAA